MRIGLIFIYIVPTNVATSKNTLTPNCHGLAVGVEKFSGVINKRVAAARSPTTAGLKPVNTDCTMCVFIYFINILLIRTISISDGSTNANVAVAEPSIAMGAE